MTFTSVYTVSLFALVGALVIFHSPWWGLLLIFGVAPKTKEDDK